MEILSWVIGIAIFMVAVAVMDHYSTWGGQGYSDHQINKMNAKSKRAQVLKWREEIESQLQQGLIDKIPYVLGLFGYQKDDDEWEEEMKRKYLNNEQ